MTTERRAQRAQPWSSSRSRGLARPSSASFAFLLLGNVSLYLDTLLPITEVNFHISDIMFLLSATALMSTEAGWRLLWHKAVRNPLATPFLLLALTSIVSLQLTSYSSPIDVAPTLTAVLQLAFVFLLLAPLVFVHGSIPRRRMVLWSVNAFLIAGAGLVSILSFAGLIQLGQDHLLRVSNPLLGVNGFWLFGLVSAFILHKVLHAWRTGHLGSLCLFATLWGLGFSGVALSGVRLGLVVSLLSLIWVAWFHLRRRVEARRAFLAVSGAVVLMTLLGWSLITHFPVLLSRVSETPVADLNRVITYEAALSDLESTHLLFGPGLGQFLPLHPGLPITVHNYYVQLLYEVGLPGLLAFVWLLLRLFRLSRPTPTPAGVQGYEINVARFAVLAVAIAGLAYPLGVARLDYILLLLAVSPVAEASRLRHPYPYQARSRPAKYPLSQSI